jgi:hypothetical protein
MWPDRNFPRIRRDVLQPSSWFMNRLASVLLGLMFDLEEQSSTPSPKVISQKTVSSVQNLKFKMAGF